MLDRFEFLLSEAFTALKRNGWMTFAAITTSAMALFLTGGVAFAYRGVNAYMNTLPSRFEMRIFLKDEVKPEVAKKLTTKFKAISGVDRADYMSKEEAWTLFKKQNPDYPTAGIKNPLPEAYTVTLKEIDKADSIAASIQKMPEVEKDGVKYMRKERDMLSQALGLLRLVGLSLGALMVITGGVLIYNAIRMTFVTRRKEFRIMEMVGAARETVIIPLMIEGIIQGVTGGIIASAFVLFSHQYLRVQLQAFSGIIQLGDLPAGMVFGWLCFAGALYGLICSVIAIRGPWRTE